MIMHEQRDTQSLTARERFLRTLDFKSVDRGFNHELPLWGQTLDRWNDEGMPQDVHIGDFMQGNEYFGFDRVGYLPLQVVEPLPPFQEETLAEDERYITVRFTDGHVSRALKEGTAHGTRLSMDQYLAWVVNSRAEFQAHKLRYNPQSSLRYPQWWQDYSRCLQGRDYPLALTRNGTFGLFSFLRRWMGTEQACMVFLDDPAWAEEMLDFMTEYLIELTGRALTDVQVDYFNYFEDFAYKTAPLIGPKIFRRFFLPRYRRINDHLRAHGVRHIWLDSDGNTEVLIPLFIEAGITVHWPMERAADMHPLKLRRTYGHDLALVGGIDKRALTQDRKAIEEELYSFVPQLLEDGGYIPTLDHAFPPDISYDNFMIYLEVKRKILGM
jgi:hypothetical protein